MIAHVKTTQSTRSRRGQKQAIDKPDLHEEYLQEGAALVAEKEVEAKEFKVGDRVICRDHPNAMDDWMIEKITAKLVHVFSPSTNQRAKLKSSQIEPYTPEKAFPVFRNGDRVKNISDFAPLNRKDMIFTVVGQHQNGMTSLGSDDGVGFSLHCSQLALAIVEEAEDSKELFKVGEPGGISVGTRVQIILPEDCAPQVYAPEGATGTVVDVGRMRGSKNSASIQLDLSPGKRKRTEVIVNLDRLIPLTEKPPAEESSSLEPEKPAILFINEGDRVRGKRASRGRSPIFEGFVVSLGDELVQLDTGKIHLSGIEIIERLQDQSPLSQITALLAAHGFRSSGHSAESGHADEDLESYEDWEIFIDNSNFVDALDETLVVIDLIHRDTCGWWEMRDQERFTSGEKEEATAWAKTIIDRVEHKRRALSGQLSLLDPAASEAKLAVDLTESAVEAAIADDIGMDIDRIYKEPTLDDQIDSLYKEATQSEETAFNAGRAALHLYRELGAKLEQRKAETKHGGWLAYLEDHGIQERKAQRAMAIARGWETVLKSDSVTDLTLTEALGRISVKTLPAVDQDEQERRFKLVCTAYDSVYPGGFRSNSNGVFPFVFEAPGFQKTFTSLDAALEQHLKIWQKYDRYQKSNPAPTAAPAIEEIKDYYAQIGTVKDWNRRGFSVERPDLGNPFPLAFKNASVAWSYWEKNGARLLEIAQRKPQSSQVYEQSQEAELSELEAVDAVATVVSSDLNSVTDVVSSTSNQSSVTATQIHELAFESVTSIFEKLSSMGVDVAAIVDMANILEDSIRETLEENLLKD